MSLQKTQCPGFVIMTNTDEFQQTESGTMSESIEFFEYPRTRSNRVRWALEELGMTYRTVVVDRTAAGNGRAAFNERACVLSAAVAQGRYILGGPFSGADIAVGHSCDMARRTGLIDDFPELKAYLDRLSERPAHRRVYAE